ncbi:hypothetical protein TBLA_0I01330 [Henningerozyma blattae CBS 6284]|uniref:CS domain-containing protein n=1 Tax=Henningerozyma blattae (strain ATCC 34711 / CBS 6284 / DSM 70876 / NBRC 10599 / NRRL Y-10934 / UCD 77-7) TaxID=1071380 RepID=I2H8U1_HENB6|nr:hypothetical protein TBLA_0I01330 [Tetrapisispora blattae CBS 6284]CCH62793.1 hypothetical protein TBLA_0I01330 [Tetrapisispora blattae CBS 6284]
MSTKILTPQVQWAQRSSETDADKNYLLLTINIPDCLNPKVSITSTSLKFEANSKSHEGNEEVKHKYEFSIDFFKEISEEKTMNKIANGQHYFLKIYKKDLGLEYWPRLTKEKIKYNFIKTDFDKWVDEDEQDEVDDNQNDMDYSNMMMGGAGAGGAGGMDMAAMSQAMAAMGGAGGAGGAGGLDMEALRKTIEESGGNIDDFAKGVSDE